MAEESSQPLTIERLREAAEQQRVHPSDEDLEGVLGFVTRVLPALAEIEERLPPETPP
jgi:hypothetical protein